MGLKIVRCANRIQSGFLYPFLYITIPNECTLFSNWIKRGLIIGNYNLFADYI